MEFLEERKCVEYLNTIKDIHILIMVSKSIIHMLKGERIPFLDPRVKEHTLNLLKLITPIQ